jgi:5-bromo-4-chloroindolyl phosphate hydrolysis protein
MNESSFEKLLETLTKKLIVEHIMTPRSELLTCDFSSNILEIKSVMESRNYDIFPFVKGGKIEGYIKREDIKKDTKIDMILNKIEREELVTESTPLLELIELLIQRDFFFVIKGSEIVGFVHFSDLNKRAVRVLFYLYLSEFESRLHEWIKKEFPNDNWKLKLNNENEKLEDIKKIYLEIRQKNSEISEVECLFFSHMLTIATKTSTEFKKYSVLNNFRNEIVHPTRPLIYNYSRVKKLNEKRHLLEDGINKLDKILKKKN